MVSEWYISNHQNYMNYMFAPFDICKLLIDFRVYVSLLTRLGNKLIYSVANF